MRSSPWRWPGASSPTTTPARSTRPAARRSSSRTTGTGRVARHRLTTAARTPRTRSTRGRQHVLLRQRLDHHHRRRRDHLLRRQWQQHLHRLLGPVDPMTTTRVRAAIVAAATSLLALTGALLAAPAQAATVDGGRSRPRPGSARLLAVRAHERVADLARRPAAGRPGLPPAGHGRGFNQPVGRHQRAAAHRGGGVPDRPVRLRDLRLDQPGRDHAQNVPCVRSDAGGGFLRVDPQGASSWTLNRTGRNVAQVQLAVRAAPPGSEPHSRGSADSGSTVVCEGTRCERVPSVGSPSPRHLHRRHGQRRPAEDPQGGDGRRRRLRPGHHADRPQGAGHSPGRDRPAPGGSSAAARSDLVHDIATNTVSAGAGYHSLITTATGLQPATTHRFRACFTPTGGSQTCGSEIQLTTASA